MLNSVLSPQLGNNYLISVSVYAFVVVIILVMMLTL